ncbi:hypothetical protein ZHAS_00015272 [Anopheles sinensis]|uniref:Uncharacterized protein n=1 Tax=Anopheles sinensis TaxID=74873 RepID=A0A084WAK5_ANOSI|nr:hypothetical protein ZHAS_00015272 [Anopheles sinensis]
MAHRATTGNRIPVWKTETEPEVIVKGKGKHANLATKGATSVPSSSTPAYPWPASPILPPISSRTPHLVPETLLPPATTATATTIAGHPPVASSSAMALAANNVVGTQPPPPQYGGYHTAHNATQLPPSQQLNRTTTRSQPQPTTTTCTARARPVPAQPAPRAAGVRVFPFRPVPLVLRQLDGELLRCRVRCHSRKQVHQATGTGDPVLDGTHQKLKRRQQQEQWRKRALAGDENE